MPPGAAHRRRARSVHPVEPCVARTHSGPRPGGPVGLGGYRATTARGGGRQPYGGMTREADAIEPTFCTVVDLNYLPRALALYRSLEQTCPGFKLHILCMEAGVQPLLERLTARHAALHDIATLEGLDPELATVKDSRTGVEYCWTVKATLCRYLLENEPGLDVVTYVDSDLLFF